MKIKVRRNSEEPRQEVSAEVAFSAVSSSVARAAMEAHEALTRLGVPHALVGGLAVGAHGCPYATKDVDFLVTDAAFEKVGFLVAFLPGVPIQIHGVQIDYLSVGVVPETEAWLAQHGTSSKLAVVPIEMLIFMKLSIGRMKDKAAVVELLKHGIDEPVVEAYLATHAPKLLPAWRASIKTALAESRHK